MEQSLFLFKIYIIRQRVERFHLIIIAVTSMDMTCVSQLLNPYYSFRDQKELDISEKRNENKN